MTNKPNVPTQAHDYSVFVNSASESYVIHGLSPMLPEKLLGAVRAEYEKVKGKLPAAPTYEVETASGEKELHLHDATTLVVPNDETQTAENQATWARYTLAQAAINEEYNVRLMRAVFMAVEAKPTQGWRDEMKFLGVTTPPENSPAEKYAFIETHVIQSPEDLSKLMTSVFRMAGIISEAAVAEVDATFQRAMETAFAEAGKPGNQDGKLESKPVLHGSGDGSFLEQDTGGTRTMRPKR